MKHIKTYENIIYKKYIIVKSNRKDIKYYILTVYNYNEDEIFYSGFACYNDEYNVDKFIIREGDKDGGKIPINDFPILYETDDFKDAKNRLDFMIQNDAEKYNL